MNLEGLWRKFDKLQSTIQAGITVNATFSGVATTLTSSIAVASSSVAAGSKFVTFTTSGDFTGTINGVTRDGSVSFAINPGIGNTNPAIPFTITGGSITLDVTT